MTDKEELRFALTFCIYCESFKEDLIKLSCNLNRFPYKQEKARYQQSDHLNYDIHSEELKDVIIRNTCVRIHADVEGL